LLTFKKAFVRKETRFPTVQSFRPSSKREPFSDNLPDASTKESADKKLDLKDLKWQDKERILRVLFAKMNGLSVVRAQAQQSTSSVPIAPQKREISAYHGGEYPTGAEAFTGSMADRVDRIISIDDDHVDGKPAETQIRENVPLLPEEPKFEMDVAPPTDVPSITMNEEEFSLPPILVVPEV
jgi:hypothetical protein